MSDLDLLEEEELDLSAGLVPFPPEVHPDALRPDIANWDRDDAGNIIEGHVDAAGNITNYDAPRNEELDLSAGARSVLQPVKTQTQSKQ